MAFLKTYSVDTFSNGETNTTVQIGNDQSVVMIFHADCEKYGIDGVKLKFLGDDEFLTFANDIMAIRDIVMANKAHRESCACTKDYCEIHAEGGKAIARSMQISHEKMERDFAKAMMNKA